MTDTTGDPGRGSAAGDLPEGPIRVFLVDDQALVRAGFRMVLDTQDDIEVVGEAGDGQAALDALARTEADIVLMDVRMPRMDGVTATQILCRETRVPRVVVLTTFDLDEYAHAALRAGAAGFLLKDAGPEEILAAIRAVHRGDSVIAPSTTRRLLAHFLANPPADAPGTPGSRSGTRIPGGVEPGPSGTSDVLAPLTPRELEVLTLVGRGLTNTEICAELFLAEATVKTHIGRILHKLRLRDRVQMVMLSYDTGLVRPNS